MYTGEWHTAWEAHWKVRGHRCEMAVRKALIGRKPQRLELYHCRVQIHHREVLSWHSLIRNISFRKSLATWRQRIFPFYKLLNSGNRRKKIRLSCPQKKYQWIFMYLAFSVIKIYSKAHLSIFRSAKHQPVSFADIKIDDIHKKHVIRPASCAFPFGQSTRPLGVGLHLNSLRCELASVTRSINQLSRSIFNESSVICHCYHSIMLRPIQAV